MTAPIDRLQRMLRDFTGTETRLHQMADEPVSHEFGHVLADETNSRLAYALREAAEIAHEAVVETQMRIADELREAAA